jgi:hypothetical protein
MRSVIRRAAVAAGAAVMVLGAGVGVASASGAPPVLTWSQGGTTITSFDYGTLDAGAGATKTVTFTLTNSGGMASGTLTITLAGPTAFTVTADGCTGTSLGPKKSCSVTAQYVPTANSESDSATLAATGEHASASLTLTGKSGTPDLTLSPGTLHCTSACTYSYDFGLVSAGNSKTATFTVTNSGTGTSEALSIAGCCHPGFTLSNDKTSGHTLAPGGTSTFDLTFTAPAGCSEQPFETPLEIFGTSPDFVVYIFLVATGECP